MKKQGELRSAPSEQGDFVSDGQLQIVLLPLPKNFSNLYMSSVTIMLLLNQMKLTVFIIIGKLIFYKT